MQLIEKINRIFPEKLSIPAEFRVETPVQQKTYLVNGELHHWDGPMQEVLSPVWVRTAAGLSQQVLGHYPLLTETEAVAALEAAAQAYDHGRGRWPTMAVADRIKHVQEFTYRMKEKRDQVVKLLMWEIGKSHQDAEKEFDRTVAYITDTIEALKDLDRVSSRFVIEQGIVGQIRRAPMGLVLCMGPFNYPLNETFTTLIPALLMGNPVILKPPKLGVLLYGPLLEAFREAFPPGVINILYGQGQQLIPPLMTSGKIHVLAFIGSSRVADILRKQHPQPHRLRCALGLDAKNPAIILADADLELTVRECLLGCLSFNGQRCTALKMLFVHADIVEAFLQRLTQVIESLPFGMPWEKDVSITPLPEAQKPQYLTDLISDAQDHGARVVNPAGGRVNRSFFYPAVLYPVNAHMHAYHEEQFGPVIPVASFTRLDTPIEYIVASHYGQQVSIFGSDADVIAKLIDPLVNQVCRVNINSQCQRGPDTFPFVGRKDSAEGTLSVSDALRVFSIRTLVAAKASEQNKAILTTIVQERKSNFLSTDFLL